MTRAAIVCVSSVLLGLGVGISGCSSESSGAGEIGEREERAMAGGEASKDSMGDSAFVLGHTMTRLDGTEESLEAYKGKVVLVVNTASRCGFTPQYKGLEALYQAKQGEGLVVLGFPSDSFNQELDTAAEVAAFCEDNYGVTFPMFDVVDVKGDGAAPFFRQLASQPEPAGGEPQWNFNKYLIDREGRAVVRFGSRTGPESEELRAKIEELLRG